MTSAPAKVNFRYLFKDIVYGFSEVEFAGSTFYVKHLSSLDQVDLEELEESFFQEAKKRGLPTEKEILTRLRDEEMWTTADDAEITKAEAYIESLENTRKQLYLKTQIEDNVVERDKAHIKLNQLLSVKSNLIGKSCETHAKSRTSDHYILKSFYEDRELQNPYFSEEKIDELSKDELLEIVISYNNKILSLNDDNIQRIVLQDFYNLYMPFAENSQEFYGKAICDLSYNQLKLLIYSRYFKNIFSNNDKMPEYIKKDPEKIIDYVNANENVKKVKDKNDEKDYSAESLVGATAEDLEYLGVKSKGEDTLSLSEEAKKKGGSLSMDDMMNLFG